MRREWVVDHRWALGLIVLLILGCEPKPQVLFEVNKNLTINGSEVYVKQYAFGTDSLDAFEKEPLVIVHGGPVLDHSYFLPYLDELARDYQLVFYDQRACGKSSVAIDTASMSIDGFVDDIEQLRDQLGIEKMNLLGHSWGGMLAMRYGVKYPNRLNKLVLSSAMAPSSTDWQNENMLIGQRVTQTDLDERKALISSGILQSEDPREGIRTLLMQSFKHQMYDPTNLEKLDLFVPIDYMKRSQLFGMLSPGLSNYDLYPDLGKVTCPTLLIYGETEPASDLYVDKILKLLPDARLEIVKKAGHFPFVEETAAYNQRIKAFLNQ